MSNWANTSKNSSSFTNQTKNSATFSNITKNSSDFTNQTKNTSNFNNQVKTLIKGIWSQFVYTWQEALPWQMPGVTTPIFTNQTKN